MQLADWVASLSEGLDTIVAGEGDGLSGGQRQRLALARALLLNARFVTFDEPTAHLEPGQGRGPSCDACSTGEPGRACW